MSSQGIRLSVAIIARDEVEALKETIASVQTVADEVVVLDTGSIDSSRSEARTLGAKVFDFAWCDSFSAARNACAAHATGDWILWLDAGEVVAEEDRGPLRAFVLGEAQLNRAYAMLIRVAASSPSSGMEQVARIRLVPRRAGLIYSGRIRETLEPALIQERIEVDGIPYRIHRGQREHDLARRAERAQRNIRLAEMELREAGNQPQLFNCLGDAFQTLNNNTKAAEFFRRALVCAPAESSDSLEAYYGLLTSLDDDAHRQQQLEVAIQASEAFPIDAQLLCALGGYLQAIGRTDVAARSYETAVRYGQINPAVWHISEVLEIAAICHSITLQLQDKLAEAMLVLENALECDQPSSRIRRHLIELLAKQGERDRALQHVDRLPRETPGREALRSAIRGACLAAKQNWIAAKAYLRTAYSAGCREPICLRWFVASLSATGERDQVLRVLEEWRRSDPGNSEVVRLLNAAQSDAGENDAARQLRVDNAAVSTPKLRPTIPPLAQPLREESGRTGNDSR